MFLMICFSNAEVLLIALRHCIPHTLYSRSILQSELHSIPQRVDQSVSCSLAARLFFLTGTSRPARRLGQLLPLRVVCLADLIPVPRSLIAGPIDLTSLNPNRLNTAITRAHRPQRDQAAYAREDLVRPDLLLEPPQRRQIDGNQREAGLENPHKGLRGVGLGQVLDPMRVQFDRDDKPRHDGAEGDESGEEDEQHGEPPLRGRLKLEDGGDRRRDDGGLDQ